VPELPLVPLNPDVPLVPEVPEVPLVPDVPLEPAVPLDPLEPLEPAVPLDPEVPDCTHKSQFELIDGSSSPILTFEFATYIEYGVPYCTTSPTPYGVEFNQPPT
jgi:hypothetical protein